MAPLLLPHSPKSSVILPKLSVSSLKAGIQALEDFGFRTESSLTLPPRLSLLTEHSSSPSKPILHVTDLWSLRQQMEFLTKTGLRQAQRARERQIRKEAFITSLERVAEGRENDQEYNRLTAETNPLEAGKCYAAGREGRLWKQLRNQVVMNSPEPQW